MSKLWATVIDSSTKKCMVGFGSNEALYKKMGMHLMEVEQGCDGNYYIKGYTPKCDNELKEVGE